MGFLLHFCLWLCRCPCPLECLSTCTQQGRVSGSPRWSSNWSALRGSEKGSGHHAKLRVGTLLRLELGPGPEPVVLPSSTNYPPHSLSPDSLSVCVWLTYLAAAAASSLSLTPVSISRSITASLAPCLSFCISAVN